MQPGLLKRIEVGADGKPQEVRFFSNASIQSSIDAALAGVTTNGAVLHVEKSEDGWNAAVAARLNGHWSVAVAYSREEWGNAVGATVKLDW
jgi:hypothetical protein